MKTMKSIIAVSLTVCFAIMLMAMMSAQPAKGKPWDIPAKYKDMKNAVKSTDASVQAGELLYRKNCASCHGKTGIGDGIKAKNLETFPGDFTTAEFQGQADGVLFYQSKFGRNEMPKYENKIEDNDIWNMVNYIRTLKK
jgi:mono/diheme cytochrome c family protein